MRYTGTTAFSRRKGTWSRSPPHPPDVLAVGATYGAVRGMDQVYAPDVAIAVEDVIIFVLPLAGDSGHVGAAKDQRDVRHPMRLAYRPSRRDLSA